MRTLLAALAFLAVSAPTSQAFALSVPDSAKLRNQNLIQNPGFESGKAGYTASGVTITIATSGSNKLFDGASATFDFSAASQYVETSLFAVPQGMISGDCSGELYYKGGDTNVAVRVIDSTPTTLNSITLSAASATTRARVDFTCPASGSIKLRVEALGNAAQIAVDSLYLGSRLPIYTSTSSQTNDPGVLENLSLFSSMGGNTLTLAIKTQDGGDPDGSDSARIAVRNPTVTNGSYNIRTVSAATSLIVSSGSTLGHRASASEPIHLYAVDNSGTIVLGASSVWLDDSKLVTTVAEGGAGAADSFNTLYTTNALTNVAFRYIGMGRSTQGTPGTWVTALTELEVAPYGDTKRPKQMWTGYHDSDCNFTRATASFGDFSADATCTFTERLNRNMGSVTSYLSGSDPLPGVVFYPAEVGSIYRICAEFYGYNASAPTVHFRIQDVAGAITLNSTTQSQNSGSQYMTSHMCGDAYFSGTSAVTIAVQSNPLAGTQNMGGGGTAHTVEWHIERLY